MYRLYTLVVAHVEGVYTGVPHAESVYTGGSLYRECMHGIVGLG